nr:unnamed protein product [Callosobruchus chinensis]
MDMEGLLFSYPINLESKPSNLIITLTPKSRFVVSTYLLRI